MPNIQWLRLPPLDPAETGWREFASWRVPLDDTHYVTFNVNLYHVPPEAAADFHQRRAATLAKGMDVVAGLAQGGLAGRPRIDDVRVRVWVLVRRQDDVLLAGRGATPESRNEHLGRSDRSLDPARRRSS